MNGNEEEIFCDDNSRLEMIDRIFKGRLLPLLILFFLGLVPQFVLQISKQNYSLATVIGAIIIFYVVIFATYAVKRYQYKKKIDQ